MKNARSIVAGVAVGLTLFVVVGFAYRIGRHSFEETDTVDVLGQPVTASWTSTEALPEGRGLVVVTPLVSSSRLGTGEPPDDAAVIHSTGETSFFASLKSDDPVPIEAELVSRSIVNRFGTELYSWRCTVKGAVDADSGEYYLLVSATGGGDAGATVKFNVQHQRNSEFVLTIEERLWSSKTRKCSFRFRIDGEGEIGAVED